jgi:ferrochelatase
MCERRLINSPVFVIVSSNRQSHRALARRIEFNSFLNPDKRFKTLPNRAAYAAFGTTTFWVFCSAETQHLPVTMFSSPRYYGPARIDAQAKAASAIVLVNLGTPDAPTPRAVRRYLKQFLMDPRVIEQPRWLWWLILQVILLIRPARSARAYASIWTRAGSPLLVFTTALAQKLAHALRNDFVPVRVGMSYGQPDLRRVISELTLQGVRRLLLVPLYPQYSGSSTGAVIDALADTLKTLRWPPEMRWINDYHAHPAYIEALARSVQAHWREHGQADRLLLSFHGIPQRYVANGDPYFSHCMTTAQRLAQQLALPAERLIVSFQSRVGREPWLSPYTDETLRALPGQGVRSLQVLCPGFAVDCLETLEEIAMQNREVFLKAGGERFEYIAALNDSEDHVTMLQALVAQYTGDWSDLALDNPPVDRSRSNDERSSPASS